MELSQPVPPAPPIAALLLTPADPARSPAGLLPVVETAAPRTAGPALPSPAPNAAWLPTDDVAADPLR